MKTCTWLASALAVMSGLLPTGDALGRPAAYGQSPQPQGVAQEAAGAAADSGPAHHAISATTTPPTVVTAPVALFREPTRSTAYTWLHGSRYEDPAGVFQYVDTHPAQLRIRGNGLGYWGTRTSYRDYHLCVEYRWGQRNWPPREHKARDAGLFLHATGPDGNSVDGDGAFRAAIECQIMEGATGDLMLIRGHNRQGASIPLRLTATVADQRDRDGWPTFAPGGTSTEIAIWGRVNHWGKSPHWADRFGFRGARSLERPAGCWNRLECLCRGDTIEVCLNGRRINHATAVWPTAGAILLQCELSEIDFRNLTLRPLPRHPNRTSPTSPRDHDRRPGPAAASDDAHRAMPD